MANSSFSLNKPFFSTKFKIGKKEDKKKADPNFMLKRILWQNISIPKA